MTAGAQSAGLLEWRQGWKVVLAAGIGTAIGGLHYHFIGTMMRQLQAAYFWERGQIAFGITLITFIQIAAQLGVGALIDRIGARRVALIGVWVFAFGFSLLGMAGPHIWSWYAVCAFFAVADQGVSPVVWTSGIVRWFTRQRGMALATAFAVSGVTVAIVPGLAIWLVEQVGLRLTFVVIGFGGALVMFVPALLFFRDSPQAAFSQSVSAEPLVGHSVEQALSGRRFWQLMVAFSLVACGTGTVMVHNQPMLIDSGLSAAQAASVAMVIGPSMIAGRLSIGALFDRFDTRIIGALAFLLPAAAALGILLLDGRYAVALAAGVVIGLCMGAEIDALAYLTSRYFGPRAYGVLFAALAAAYGIGTGIGSALAGSIFDALQNYQPWLIAMALASLGATALILTMGRPPRHF